MVRTMNGSQISRVRKTHLGYLRGLSPVRTVFSFSVMRMGERITVAGRCTWLSNRNISEGVGLDVQSDPSFLDQEALKTRR
jgi:hypothetical protein